MLVETLYQVQSAAFHAMLVFTAYVQYTVQIYCVHMLVETLYLVQSAASYIEVPTFTTHIHWANILSMCLWKAFSVCISRMCC